MDVLSDVSILPVIEEYLGEAPALSLRKTTLRCTRPSPNSGWHQDGAFLGKGIRTVNLWMALTDCGVDAPSMDMVPKRLNEIVPTGTGKAAFSWSLDDEAVNQVAEDCPPITLQFRAGDAIMFDEVNLHRTAIGTGMTKNRYAIEAWFFAPSAYPLEQIPVLC
jgi:ectoine hydroxylase-related dioxygenase (phytanoyl-CoA dioxygenase family)